MKRSRFSTSARRASLLVTGGTLLFAAGACEKLVGIEDTEVVAGNTAGKSPVDHGGSSGAGGSRAGSATAGSTADAGADETSGATNGGTGGGMSGGPNAGSAGKGGNSNGGASAGTGGGAPQCGDCKPPTPICEAGTCVARGPTQKAAGTQAGGTSFYIDSTEVTNAQYAVFLAAKGGDTSGQRSECAWNKSYQPSAAIGDDKRPAVNVDFCDAVAYCDWAGERLCGALGGGPVATAALNDATVSQWYLACAGPDGERYPYGGFDFKADNCNVYFSGNMADAGSFKNCEGHYAGVFDLVGNAAEWIDSCDSAGGADHTMDKCQLMGGSYLREDYKCQSYFDWERNGTADSFGFRCCSK